VRRTIVAALVVATVGVAVGWTVNGWRLGSTIERLEGQNTAFEGANKRCTTAVVDVQAAVKGLYEQGEQRAKLAEAAVKAAAGEAKAHLGRAQAALERPPAAKGDECGTAAREARAYVDKRRAQ